MNYPINSTLFNQISEMDDAPNACPVCGNQWGPCPCDLEVEEIFLLLIPSPETFLKELFVSFEETMIENLLSAPFFVTDSFAS